MNPLPKKTLERMLKVKYFTTFLQKQVKIWDQNVFWAKNFLYLYSNLGNKGLVPL